MIAFDTATGNAASPAAGPLTWSHTVTGASTLLLVGVKDDQNTVTGVTYNGVAMTQVGPTLSTGSSGFLQIWGLLNPATGANTVSVAYTGTRFVNGISASYTGVLQSGFPDATSSAQNASTTSLAGSITTVLANCWVAAFSAGGVLSAGTGQTSRRAQDSFELWGDSNAGLPTGSNSLTTTRGSAAEIGMVLVSFAPVPTNTGNFLAFL